MMVIGQMFRINESRLPKVYRNKLICFLVVGEETSIDADGQWITKIKGQMQLFPGVPEELNPEKYGVSSSDLEAYNDREASESSRTGETPWEDFGVSENDWYSMSPREQERLKQELKAKEAAEAAEEERIEEEANFSPCDGVTCNENELHVEVNGECECQCAPGFNLIDGKCVAIEAEEVAAVEPPIDGPGPFDQSNPKLSYEITAGVGSGAEHTWTIARGWNFAGMTGWERVGDQHKKNPKKTITDDDANELFFFGSDTPKNMVEEDRTIYYSEYQDDYAYSIEECYELNEWLYEGDPDEFKAWMDSGFDDEFDYVE